MRKSRRIPKRITVYEQKIEPLLRGLYSVLMLVGAIAVIYWLRCSIPPTVH